MLRSVPHAECSSIKLPVIYRPFGSMCRKTWGIKDTASWPLHNFPLYAVVDGSGQGRKSFSASAIPLPLSDCAQPIPERQTQATRPPTPLEIPRCSASDLCAKGASRTSSVLQGGKCATEGSSVRRREHCWARLVSWLLPRDYGIVLVLGAPTTLALLVHGLHFFLGIFMNE